MILTQAQAEAVYSAMVALNNVGGRIAAAIDGGEKEVCGMRDGAVVVHANYGLTEEQHANQAAFATAYGLQQG